MSELSRANLEPKLVESVKDIRCALPQTSPAVLLTAFTPLAASSNYSFYASFIIQLNAYNS